MNPAVTQAVISCLINAWRACYMQTIAHLLRYFEDMPTYIVGRDCEDTPALPHLSVSISRAVQTQQLHVQTWKRQIERIIISSFLETSSYNNLYFIRSNSEIMVFLKKKHVFTACACHLYTNTHAPTMSLGFRLIFVWEK